MGLSKPKKKKSSQNHCAVEVSLGKLVNVFSNRTEKVDLTTLTITLNEKKNPQEKYKAFLEQLLYALCTSAIWLLLFLKKRKKKN